MSSALVKFHGNALCVSHDDSSYKIVVQELIKIASELKRAGSSNTWDSTQNGLKDLVQRVVDPHGQIQQYQLDLLSEVLIPYLKKQKDRYYTDPTRVRQMNEIVYALSLPKHVHPAICLNILDRVKDEISQNQSYLWKSELLTVLETAVAKQWLPIVHDTRQFLVEMSGKLFVVGLIGVVGWPMVLLSPLIYSSKKLLKAMEEWEKRKQLSNQTILEFAKIIVMIMVLMQLLSVLQVYAAMGRLCVALSVVGYLLAQSDDLVKSVAPVLAPHALLIDQLFTSLAEGDLSKVMKVVSHRVQQESTTFPRSERVEEVLCEEKETAVTPSQEEDHPKVKVSGEETRGRESIGSTVKQETVPRTASSSDASPNESQHNDSHHQHLQSQRGEGEKDGDVDAGLRKRRIHVRL